jgi:hypothetical protein
MQTVKYESSMFVPFLYLQTEYAEEFSNVSAYFLKQPEGRS